MVLPEEMKIFSVFFGGEQYYTMARALRVSLAASGHICLSALQRVDAYVK